MRDFVYWFQTARAWIDCLVFDTHTLRVQAFRMGKPHRIRCLCGKINMRIDELKNLTIKHPILS